MADSSDVDNAIVSKLGADAALLALCPNGVYFDDAPPGMTKYVAVALIEHHDEPMFGGTAFETALYLVEARMLSTAGGDPKAAAARIDALLHNGTLTVPGYSLMCMRRLEHSRPPVERDVVDQSLRWFRRGARYEVVVSP